MSGIRLGTVVRGRMGELSGQVIAPGGSQGADDPQSRPESPAVKAFSASANE
jgi:hypothetical protein